MKEIRRHKSSLPKALNVKVGNFTLWSYEWVWKWSIKEIKHDAVDVKVSDWNNCEKCSHCNKDIVHIFTAQKDGEAPELYGKDCLEKITGIRINNKLFLDPLSYILKDLFAKSPETVYKNRRGFYNRTEKYKHFSFDRKDLKALTKCESIELLEDSNTIQIKTTMRELYKVKFKAFYSLMQNKECIVNDIKMFIVNQEEVRNDTNNTEIIINIDFPEINLHLQKETTPEEIPGLNNIVEFKQPIKPEFKQLSFF